jgi:PKD repeat protein
MVAGGSAVIDSFQSTVNPEVPDRTIDSYTWTFFNMTTPETLPLIVAGSDSWVEAMLDEPGEYSVTLTVTDSAGEQSSGDDSMAHVQFTVVGGSFNPSSLTVAPEGTVTATVTVTPSSAFNLVTLAPAPGDEGKLSVTPTTLTSASQTVAITAGTEPGPFRIVAQIGEGGYYEVAGRVDVTIQGSQAPTAVAKTTTPLIVIDGTAALDGSASHANAEGRTIDEYNWRFDNITTPQDDAFTVTTQNSTLSRTLSVAGEYSVTLTVKDSAGEVSDASASLTIKVVGVTFDPDPVLVALVSQSQ